MTAAILTIPTPQKRSCAEDLTTLINAIGAQRGLPPLLLWSRNADQLIGLADFLKCDAAALADVQAWASACGDGQVRLSPDTGTDAAYTAAITIGGRPALVRAIRYEVSA